MPRDVDGVRRAGRHPEYERTSSLREPIGNDDAYNTSDEASTMEYGTVSWEAGSLTRRELEVLGLVVEGLSAKEIAIELCIAPRTVECHIEHLRSKTNSRNRAQMSAEAVRSGVVPMMRTIA